MIRLLDKKDAGTYRKLRLKSLETDPLSFVSQLVYEEKYPEDYFLSKIVNSTKLPIYGIYGYFVKGKLIATAQLGFSYYAKKVHIAYLYEIYVLPEYRRKAIASKFIKNLIKLTKSVKKIEFIELKVNSKNKDAIRFYENLSFKRIATLPRSVKEPNGSYQDEFIYRLHIKSTKKHKV